MDFVQLVVVLIFFVNLIICFFITPYFIRFFFYIFWTWKLNSLWKNKVYKISHDIKPGDDPQSGSGSPLPFRVSLWWPFPYPYQADWNRLGRLVVFLVHHRKLRLFVPETRLKVLVETTGKFMFLNNSVVFLEGKSEHSLPHTYMHTYSQTPGGGKGWNCFIIIIVIVMSKKGVLFLGRRAVQTFFFRWELASHMWKGNFHFVGLCTFCWLIIALGAEGKCFSSWVSQVETSFKEL